jgi:UDP-3-O-[3-hydroxymyristoyl] glucosamine N-acyltransferase
MIESILMVDIIDFLGNDIIAIYGDPSGIRIKYFRAPQDVDEHTLDWIGSAVSDKQAKAEQSSALVLITDPEIVYSEAIIKMGKTLIQVADPKLAIARIAGHFFEKELFPNIHPTAVIHPLATIGIHAYIGPNVCIGNCNIGDNVTIFGNVFIYDNVVIKNNVEIHNGTSIGSEAHNFVKDKKGIMLKFPHLGGVIIEDDVLIGANSVISRGVLEDTIIKRGTKIAQLVIIGANNLIGENCAIRANVMTAGSVVIGKNSIIAPSATIREHCSIGEGSFIGMGAVVTKNVPAGETWFGNPASKRK